MKHVVKVVSTKSDFRITVPRKIIQALRWNDVRYVVAEILHKDKIVIRRLLDGKALKEGDTEG